MREFNNTSRIFIVFNLREVRITSRAFSFVLDELSINYKLSNSKSSINYKLVNNELSINNTSFEYVIILTSKSSIRNKSKTSRIRNL